MKKIAMTSICAMICLSFGSVAQACDMHGGGFMGFNSMHNATWTPYNPRVSTIDPAFSDEAFDDDVMARALKADRTYRQKARPSFSNAAQSAAVAAQMRFAKKLDNSLEVERPQDIVEKEKQVLNSDS